MASKYGKTYAESGILRKNDIPDKIEDLLVFGYACKLFRDDEKALEIDQGKHLIPWMGDETLKIDRYDGRAALSDLSSYENTSEGYDTARWLGLTDSERHVEQLCDEERYRALNTNEDEEEMYREEELKRLHQQLSNAQNYGQVSYSYESGDNEEKREGKSSTDMPVDTEDEPFIAPPDLDLPINMKVPETVKQHTRIEKTAMFISKQGAQMEILLKAKQAGNPQFDFLSQECPLYPYYRHILMAIKTGHYRIQRNDQKNECLKHEEDDDHYLHPSLAAACAPRVESAPSIPNITYKPSADCAYTMLISKIKGTKPQEQPPVEPPKEQPQPSPMTAENTSTFIQNNTYVFDYTTRKYETNTGLPESYSSTEKPRTEIPAETPLQYTSMSMLTPNALMQAYGIDAATAAQYAAYMQSYGAYYTSGGNLQTGEISKGAVLYGKENSEKPPLPPDPMPNSNKLATNSTSQYNSQVYTQYGSESTQTQPHKGKPKPLLPIAHYSSGSESDSDVEDENTSKAIINVLAYEIPPPDIQLIVDKMASYVARNGRDFENIVRAKGDPRFSFLDKEHVFYAYYKHKLKTYGAVFEEEIQKNDIDTEEKIEEKKTDNDNEENVTEVKCTIKEKKIIAPVSFSIKKSKENEPVTIEKSALPVEESSDEDEKEDTSEDGADKWMKTDIQQCKADSPQDITEKTEEFIAHTNITESFIENEKTEEEPLKESNPQVIEIDDTVEECIDLTDDTEEKKDARRAEDKLKDKLAAAAREKLSSISRDRALQQERKRRAAAFLSKIKPEKIPKCSMNGTNAIDDTNPPKAAEEDDLLKRMCETEDGEITSDSPESNTICISTERKRSRSRSASERRHRNRKKKKKYSRSSSSESSKKRGKKSRHSKDRKRSRKHNSRSRSRSRSSQSHSRHSRSTSVISGY